MIYLSRLILDSGHRLVRRDLGDAQQLHRTVLAAFPSAPSISSVREHFGVLYRIEPIAQSGLWRLLVQSNSEPSWQHLPAETLARAIDGRGNPAVRSIAAEYARIEVGSRWIFRLRANPTRMLSARGNRTDDRLVGKRAALLREDEQSAWLLRKGEQHGFRPAVSTATGLPELRISVQPTVHGQQRSADGSHRLTLGAVLYDGVLEVTDAAAFKQALQSGIGRGKAYGFGLMSIAAVS